jgi:hypothetical protein
VKRTDYYFAMQESSKEAKDRYKTALDGDSRSDPASAGAAGDGTGESER